MADPYFKRTPYGWCLDHLYENKYNKSTWQEYVAAAEEWLNKRELNYSVVHYSYFVRVHVYFRSIQKMGFKDAVELLWLSSKVWENTDELVKKPWTKKDYEESVREYFIRNDLPITRRKK